MRRRPIRVDRYHEKTTHNLDRYNENTNNNKDRYLEKTTHYVDRYLGKTTLNVDRYLEKTTHNVDRYLEKTTNNADRYLEKTTHNVDNIHKSPHTPGVYVGEIIVRQEHPVHLNSSRLLYQYNKDDFISNLFLFQNTSLHVNTEKLLIKNFSFLCLCV